MSRRKSAKTRSSKLMVVTGSAPRGEKRAQLVAEGLWSRRPVVFRDKRSGKLERLRRKEVREWA